MPVIPPVFAKGQGRKGGSLPDPIAVGQLPTLDAAPDDQPDAEEAPEECPEEAPEEAYEDEPDNNESKRARRNPAPAE